MVTAIMAGGKSRRFGSPKASALFRGKSLLQYSIELADKLAYPVFVIGNRDIALPRHDFPVIYDEIPHIGPLGGLHTALEQIPARHMLIMPCDMPLLDVLVYQFLLGKMSDRRPVVARSHLGLEPLVSVWPKSAGGVIKSCIAEKKYSMRDAIRKSDGLICNLHRELDAYRDEFFYNINLRSELDALK